MVFSRRCLINQTAYATMNASSRTSRHIVDVATPSIQHPNVGASREISHEYLYRSTGAYLNVI